MALENRVSKQSLEEEEFLSIERTNDLGEEAKGIISYEEAMEREIECQERIKLKFLQTSIGPESVPTSSQELPSKPNIVGTKRRSEPPSNPQSVGGCHNSHLLQQQLSDQQAPSQLPQFYHPSPQSPPPEHFQCLPASQDFHDQPSPQHLQPSLRPTSFQRPSAQLPRNLQPSLKEIECRQRIPPQALSGHPQPQFHHPSPQSPPPEHLQCLPASQDFRDQPSPQNLQPSSQPTSFQRPSAQLPRNLQPSLKEIECRQHIPPQAPSGHPQSRQQPYDQQSLIQQSHNHPQTLSSPATPFWCGLCKVPCTCALGLEQHRQGKKHKARWEEVCGKKNIGANSDKRLWCHECNVPCMNEMALAQHRAGKKHALRLVELGHLIPNGKAVVTKESGCSNHEQTRSLACEGGYQ